MNTDETGAALVDLQHNLDYVVGCFVTYASVGGAPEAYGSRFVCVYISPKNFDKMAKRS